MFFSQAEVHLKKNKMKLYTFGKAVMNSALSGTNYEPLLQFYSSYTAFAISEEVNVHSLINITQKLKGLALIGKLSVEL